MDTMPGMMDASRAVRPDRAASGADTFHDPAAILSPAIPMQRFHKGGKIEKDGVQVVDAQKGETILPLGDKKKAAKLAMKHLEGMKDGAEAAKKHSGKSEHKKKKHPFKRTMIDHHQDGSHTVMHEHESDPSQNVSSGVPDMDALMQHMQDHVGPEAEAGPSTLAAAGPAAAAPPAA